MRLAACLLLLTTAALGQTIRIIGDRNSITAGESLQLKATSSAGTAQGVFWSSPDLDIATVDSNGLVLARRPGITRIRMQSGAAVDNYSVQVLPASIRVTPNSPTLRVGQQQQFTAEALDISGGVIPNVQFSWKTYYAEITQLATSSADIGPTGVLQAKAAGRLVVRAEISYPNALQNQTLLVFGTASLRILSPQTYSLNRVPLDIASSKRTLKLNGVEFVTDLFATPDGRLIFRGTLDGLASGLMEWDQGAFRMLLPSGGGGTNAGSQLTGYSMYSVNAAGDLLVQETATEGSHVSLFSQGNYVSLAGNGAPVGNGQFIAGAMLAGGSLADSGMIVVHSIFNTTPEPNRFQDGLFRGTARGLNELVVSTTDPLPGLASPFTFTHFGVYGISSAGTVYFGATNGPNSGLYRAEIGKPVEKVLVTGDAFLGSTIRSVRVGNSGDLGFRVVSNGDVYAWVVLQDNRNLLVKLTGGSLANVQTLPYANIRGADEQFGVLVWGNVGAGQGLYQWRGGTPTLLLAQNKTSFDGSPLENVSACAFLSDGVPVCLATTTASALIGFRLDSTPTILFREGDAVDVTTPLSVTQSLGGVPGSLPQFITGGLPGSISSLNHDGSLTPVVTFGARLPGGTRFTGTQRYSSGRAADGALYVNSNPIFRLTGSTVAVGVARFPLENGELATPVNHVKTSSNGNLVFHAYASGGNNLYRKVGGAAPQELLRYAESVAPTSLPGFGTVNYVANFTVDDRGRVMALLNLSDGRRPVFVWDSGNWTAAAVVGTTIVGGQKVTGVAEFKSWGGHLLAMLFLEHGNSVAEWNGTGWTLIYDSQRVLPDGSSGLYPKTFDVNVRGDMILTSWDHAYNLIILQRANGTRHVIWSMLDYRPGDPLLFAIQDLDMREDGSAYIFALDQNDRRVLYVTRPLDGGAQPAPCTFSLSANSVQADVGGGNASVQLNTATTCTWSARSDSGWVTLRQTGGQSGPGTVELVIAASTLPRVRTAVVTIGGRDFTVTQAAAAGVSPVIQGVYDAWSYRSGVAPGTWVTILGTNMATRAQTWTLTGPSLPTNVAGTTVTFNGKSAALYYVSATQVNALVPASIASGPVDVVVLVDGVPSVPLRLTATAVLPAIYTVAGPESTFHVTAAIAGTGTLVGNRALDTRVVGGAKPGESIDLYMIGLGATVDGSVFLTDRSFSGGYPVAASVTATVGDKAAPVAFAGLVSPGLYLVRLTVPLDVSVGLRPIEVRVGAATTRTSTTLLIEDRR